MPDLGSGRDSTDQRQLNRRAGEWEQRRTGDLTEWTLVAFYSDASNLVAGDTNQKSDAFIRDVQKGKTQRVSVSSVGEQGNGNSYSQALSVDGRYVGFYSDATNLVPADTNNVQDVFVRDRQTGTTQRASVNAAGEQGNGNSFSFNTALSSKGRFVTFESDASNLVVGDSNGVRDVFVRSMAP